MKTQPAGQPDSRNIPQTSVRNQRPSRGGAGRKMLFRLVLAPHFYPHSRGNPNSYL